MKLRFIAAPGYYLYRHRFQFTTTTPGVTLGEAQLPRGEQKTDDYFGEVEVYYGVLDVELPVSNPDSRSFGLRVSYQGCADQGLCYPPETEMLTIGDELRQASSPRLRAPMASRCCARCCCSFSPASA